MIRGLVYGHRQLLLRQVLIGNMAKDAPRIHRLLADEFLRMFSANQRSEGALLPVGTWPALAPSTMRQKGNSRKLYETGQMQESWRKSSNAHLGSVWNQARARGKFSLARRLSARQQKMTLIGGSFSKEEKAKKARSTISRMMSRLKKMQARMRLGAYYAKFHQTGTPHMPARKLLPDVYWLERTARGIVQNVLRIALGKIPIRLST